jgi:hypothetical protein
MEAYANGAGRRGLGRLRYLSALVTSAIATLTVGAWNANAGTCPTSPIKVIASCCTIAHHGIFVVQNDITSSSGTCITVTVPNAGIDMNGHSITNTGTALTGIAIDVLNTAPNTIIIGNYPGYDTLAGPEISNFNLGIRSGATNVAIIDVQATGNNKGVVINGHSNAVALVDADNNQKVGIQLNVNAAAGQNATDDAIIMSTADSNLGSGAVLNGAGSTFIYNVEASSNSKFGFWLNGASNNNLFEFAADSNGIGGVMLGCNAGGLTGVPCAVASKGNNLVGGTINSASTNSVADSNIFFGVGMEIGSANNHVVGVEGSSNGTDAIDKNPACGTDLWLGNSFTTTSPNNLTPICIH